MNDIHGRGAAGRYDASAVVDVGGAARPGEGSDPTSGDDASGDASGARMGGSDPVGLRSEGAERRPHQLWRMQSSLEAAHRPRNV